MAPCPILRVVSSDCSDGSDRIAAQVSKSAPPPPEGISRNWTVKQPGAVPPPRSDDYTKWTVVQLRKECTERQFRMPRTINTEERIKKLVEFDQGCDASTTTAASGAPVAPVASVAAFATIASTAPRATSRVNSVGNDERLVPTPLRSQKSANSCIRLLNVLFSIKFSTRWMAMDSHFWMNVTREFLTNTTDYNRLYGRADKQAAAYLSSVDPAIIVPQTRSQLIAMWNRVTQQYGSALTEFTERGGNRYTSSISNFFAHCDGCTEVGYLRLCVDDKPDLEWLVCGDIVRNVGRVDYVSRNADPLHSTSRVAGKRAAPISMAPAVVPLPTTGGGGDSTAHLWQNDAVKSTSRVTDFISRQDMRSSSSTSSESVDQLLNRSAKLYELIDQIETRVDRLSAEGKDTASLETSAAMYHRLRRDCEMRLLLGVKKGESLALHH